MGLAKLTFNTLPPISFKSMLSIASWASADEAKVTNAKPRCFASGRGCLSVTLRTRLLTVHQPAWRLGSVDAGGNCTSIMSPKTEKLSYMLLSSTSSLIPPMNMVFFVREPCSMMRRKSKKFPSRVCKSQPLRIQPFIPSHRPRRRNSNTVMVFRYHEKLGKCRLRFRIHTCSLRSPIVGDRSLPILGTSACCLLKTA